MEYIELAVKIEDQFQEILIAELGELAFDSFEQREGEVKAYVPTEAFVEQDVKEIIERYNILFSATYEVVYHEDKNWNEEWEKNFSPVYISDQCVIRAHFHQLEKEYPYEIIITPKMSFGTGHHETTSLMVQSQFDVDLEGKNVMDVGCGTGVLAIMAKKLQAANVFACDIDEWAFENAKENFQLNGFEDVKIEQGIIQEVDVPLVNYDVVFANINKNVLLNDIKTYANYVIKEGYLLLSGFYQEDVNDIMDEANKYGFIQKEIKTKNNWVALVLQKA
ncbi:MAG: 50S ribosomal protein L11 methyltransferase [Cytophagales bacterium]|nr:50S ribosomal protein L11 methyltransferase [Cytophagales bacterium]